MNERAPFKPAGPLRAIVALGANLPHEGLAGAGLLAAAVRAMEAAGMRVTRASSVWASPAWPPGSDQPDYVNAVIEIDAAGWTPRSLLAALMEIERAFGRERRERWAARSLDLDIIDFAGLEVTEEGLTLPHPRAHERPFVLAPLAEMAPDWRFPDGQAAADLLQALPAPQISRLGPLGVRDCEKAADRIS